MRYVRAARLLYDLVVVETMIDNATAAWQFGLDTTDELR